MSYRTIAKVYDSINRDVDYKSWADFFEKCVSRYQTIEPGILLDLACGTGRMSEELTRRGYDVIGLDSSGEMLTLAQKRKEKGHLDKLLLLQQDMRDFELYGTVQSVLCCLGSLNYLTSTRDLNLCLDRIRNYLEPGGILLFDVDTPYKFQKVYRDRSYLFEGELPDGKEYVCTWQSDFRPGSGLCRFYLNYFFSREDGTYVREEETQTEKCYSEKVLRKALEENRLECLGFFTDFSFRETGDDPQAERWYIVARRKE